MDILRSSTWMTITYALSAALVLAAPSVRGDYVTAMTRLHRDLLGPNATYQKAVQPAAVVNVIITLTVRSLVAMNIEKESMTMKHINTLDWYDTRLSWNPSDYENITYLKVDFHDIWRPPLYIENNLDSGGLMDTSVPVWVWPAGYVMTVFDLTTETGCTVSTKHYPFDRQICDITFFMWNWIEATNLSTREEDMFRWFTENGEWDVFHSSTKLSMVKWNVYAGYPRVTYSFVLHRRTSYYIMAIMTPVLLLSVLIVLVFWVPAESGEKMGYCLTILLTYTLFLSIVSDELPPIATGISYLQLYLAFQIGLGVLATLLTTLVLHLHHKGQEPVPDWLKGLTNRFLLPVTCQRKCSMRHGKVGEADSGVGREADVVRELEVSKTAEEWEEDAMTYPAVAQVLDRLFLVLYAVTIPVSAAVFFCLMTSQ